MQVELSPSHGRSKTPVAPIQWRFAFLFLICNGPILLWPLLLNGANPFMGLLSAWLPLMAIHFIVPVLDALLPRDHRPAVGGQTHWVNRAMPMICLPLWLSVLLIAGFQLLGPDFAQANASYPQWLRNLQLAGMMLSLGSIGGTLAINPAHELIHRGTQLERLCGGLLLAATCYGAFKIEHVRGHHLNVATAKDTASAKRGQNVFAFVSQSIFGTLSQAYRLESQRIQRSAVRRWSVSGLLKNEFHLLNLVSIALAMTLWSIAGGLGLVLFLVSSLGAVFQLEVINFIEHYGLERKIDPKSGRPEAVQAFHSWNTSTAAGNLFLFNLQRHSDHHAHAGRDYLHLEDRQDAPQLPYGYGAMFLIACVPPLWRNLMHPRLDGLRAR
jgi:alkane 1-monooxygenase